MSRSQLARTPANFPRMKHRAKGRFIRKQQRENFRKALVAMESARGFFDTLADAFRPFIEAIAGLGKAFQSSQEQFQDEYALTGPTLPQANLSPYLAIANESASAMSSAYNRASRHEFERITKEQHERES